jgi:hypothetical protein
VTPDQLQRTTLASWLDANFHDPGGTTTPRDDGARHDVYERSVASQRRRGHRAAAARPARFGAVPRRGMADDRRRCPTCSGGGWGASHHRRRGNGT